MGREGGEKQINEGCARRKRSKRRRRGSGGSKDAIVWQGLLVKPENKLWTSEDNEVHTTKYDGARRARTARDPCVSVHVRGPCVQCACASGSMYLRRYYMLRARIFTRNVSFSRVIVSEIKLRYVARSLILLGDIFSSAITRRRYFAIDA